MGWTDPTTHTFTFGEGLTSANLETYLQNNMKFLGTPPCARIVNAAAQSIPDSTPTIVHLPTVRWDPQGNMTGTPDTLTIPMTGVYTIGFSCSWDANNNGVRIGIITRNASNFEVVDSRTGFAANTSDQCCSADLHLGAGDTLQMVVEQTSGAPLNLRQVLDSTAAMWARLVCIT